MKAIVNGRIVLPDCVLENKTLFFDGKIADIADGGNKIPESVEVIDASGGYVTPGFVDIHVHGGGGYDFLDSAPEATEKILHTHALHGTTSLLATTLTCPDEILCRGIKALADAASRGSSGGSEILGLHLEGPYFSAASKGAQAIKEQKIPDREELENWKELSKNSIVRIDAAPELPNMDMLADWARENGILASIGHSAANAETVMAAAAAT